MKAWVHGTTWGSDPGPMGAGVIYESEKDWCIALSGFGTTIDATWNALTLCVELFATEDESGQRTLVVYSSEPEVVAQANRSYFGTARRKASPVALEFWYLRRIVRKLGVRVKVKLGEVRHAAKISNAAAEIAADTIGNEEAAGVPEGEGAD